MIIILDDTFEDRYKYNDVEYLKEKQYQDICKVFVKVKSTDINEIIKLFNECILFCYHDSVQFLSTKGDSLISKSNSTLKENLLNTLKKENIPVLKFSLRIDSDLNNNEINKKDFYNNLELFLDNYILSGEIETRLLFWRENYKKLQFNDVCNKIIETLRLHPLNELKYNSEFKNNLKILFKDEDVLKIWIEKETPTKEIIKIINKRNLKFKK